ncbi:GAF domain-containing protein [Arthrobacter sp. MDT2-16]
MTDAYLQQWTALEAVRVAGLRSEQVLAGYTALGGSHDVFDVTGYLRGLTRLPVQDRNLIADAINELIDATGSMADGAHYSTDEAAFASGFEEYLRPLTTNPDGYGFDRRALRPDAQTVGGTGTQLARTSSGPRDGTDITDNAEVRRLQALYLSGMLDSGAEERFDALTVRTRDRFGVSSSSIAFIAEDRQVIKSLAGPIGQDLPLELSLCAVTVKAERTLVIPDATRDPLYRDHPLVTGGPKVRMYAGHPLSTMDGWRIGSLCVMDDRPRRFTEEDAADLRTLARLVQDEMWRGSIS